MICSVLSKIYSGKPKHANGTGAIMDRNVFSLFVTGGGTEITSWLFSTPGASKSVIDVRIPYSRSALNESITVPLIDHISSRSCSGNADIAGHSSRSYNCSQETAILMAESARKKSVDLHFKETRDIEVLAHHQFFGVGCTCSLSTLAPKRTKRSHPHHAHIAIAASDYVYVVDIDLSTSSSRKGVVEHTGDFKPMQYGLADHNNNSEFKFGLRDREQESLIVSWAIMRAMQKCILYPTCGVSESGGGSTGTSCSARASPFWKEYCSNGDTQTSLERDRDLLLQGLMHAVAVCDEMGTDLPSLEFAGNGCNKSNLDLKIDLDAPKDADFDRITTRIVYKHAESIVSVRSNGDSDPRTQSQPGSQPTSHTKWVLQNIIEKTYTHGLFVAEARSDSNPSNDVSEMGFPNATFPEHTLIFPGSFNPLHYGHMGLMMAASQYYQSNYLQFGGNGMNTDMDAGRIAAPPLVFEISVINADKPPLSIDECVKRLKQFSNANVAKCRAQVEDHAPSYFDVASILNPNTYVGCCMTTTPLYVEKSDLFKDCIFVIGLDTMLRLFDIKYYNNSMVQMMTALNHIIVENKCQFIVGGRLVRDGVADVPRFETMIDGFQSIVEALDTTPDCMKTVVIPPEIRNAFHGLSSEEFRMDISSTEIRKKKLSDATCL